MKWTYKLEAFLVCPFACLSVKPLGEMCSTSCRANSIWFLSVYKTINFSRRTLLHGMSEWVTCPLETLFCMKHNT